MKRVPQKRDVNYYKSNLFGKSFGTYIGLTMFFVFKCFTEGVGGHVYPKSNLR